MQKLLSRPLTLAVLGLLPAVVLASSHREAPRITETPKVDGTDLYMFRSYEPSREGYVTLIANYVPGQNPYDGPNYYMLDASAAYDIHIDNDGDAREELTFRFHFRNKYQGIALPVGPAGSEKMVPVPVLTTVPGGIGPGVLDRAGLNVIETYTIDLVRNGEGSGSAITNAAGGDNPRVFTKPVDNIGEKSIPDYAAYANNHIYGINIPGCGEGRVFVGQRNEPFFINVGEIFDLVNTNAVGPPDAEQDDLADKNVTSLALEVPVACLTKGKDPVIGAWTTASQFSGKNKDGNATYAQVSRLGMPLVNEVVIGLRDKDGFNRSRPANDPRFLDYVTNPTLPELLEALFGSLGVAAPNNFPRNDLVAVFLTGVKGLNQPANLRRPGEMQRLNTGIAPAAAADQNNLGVLGGDLAGFPNGRRPGDDVVDIELRVAMGVLCTLDALEMFGCVPADAPAGGLLYTDGVTGSAADYDEAFPYLTTPLAGSPAN